VCMLTTTTPTITRDFFYMPFHRSRDLQLRLVQWTSFFCLSNRGVLLSARWESGSVTGCCREEGRSVGRRGEWVGESWFGGRRTCTRIMMTRTSDVLIEKRPTLCHAGAVSAPLPSVRVDDARPSCRPGRRATKWCVKPHAKRNELVLRFEVDNNGKRQLLCYSPWRGTSGVLCPVRTGAAPYWVA